MFSSKVAGTISADCRRPAALNGALLRRHMTGPRSKVSATVLALAAGLAGSVLLASPATADSFTVGDAAALDNAIASENAATDGSTNLTLSGSFSTGAVTLATNPPTLNIDTDGAYTLTLDGANALWNAGSYDYVTIFGANGGGGLTVSGGAELDIDAKAADPVNHPGSLFIDANLAVQDSGSSLTVNDFIAGRNGDSAAISLTNGGHITTRSAWIGEDANSTMASDITLLVDGTGSLWKTGYFAAGGATNTVGVTVSGGGAVEADGASIGRNGPGSLLVTGAGSSFAVDGSLLVGERSFWISTPGAGDGTVTISDGGLVSASSVLLGLTGTNDHDPDITGTLVVDTGGTLATGELAPGYGTGTATFNGGTLRATDNSAFLIHDFAPGNFVLEDEGMFLDSNGLDVIALSAMSGDGDLTKLGQGALFVLGANSYEGVTYVNEGSLRSGTYDTFSPNSDHRVAANAAIQLLGYDQTVKSLYNAGTVGLGYGTAGTTLTITNDYVGDGGVININTALGDDASTTDIMRVNGASTGNGSIFVYNAGGTGAQTVEGIRIVDVAGASTGHFDLIGNYLFEGAQAVVGGAYAYRLYQGSVGAPGDGDWYLRSTLIPTDNGPGDPGDPVYQAGVPLYESYPRALAALHQPGTLQQRVGNRSWAGDDHTVGVIDLGGRQIEVGGMWGRIEGEHGHDALDTTSGGASNDSNLWRLQAGVDSVLNQSAQGALIGGAYLDYGLMSTDVASFFGDGSISTSGFGAGGTLTWYDAGGFYLDGVAQLHWFDSTLSSSTAGLDLVKGNAGFGAALSLEAGRQIALGEQWSITPQAQLVYNNAGFAPFTDGFGADVSGAGSGGFNGRLGLSVDYDDAKQDNDALARRHFYGIANLYYDFAGTTQVEVADTALRATAGQLAGGLGLGGSYDWDGDRQSLYGEASFRTDLDDPAKSYSLNGNIGLRGKW